MARTGVPPPKGAGKWSDGEPLTAADVVFTFDLIYDKAIPASQREGRRSPGITCPTARWTRDGRVSVAGPDRPDLSAISTAPILPRHKLEAIWKAGKFNTALALDTPPADLVGNGPFTIASYTHGQRIVFKRNRYYWRRSKEGEPLPHLYGGITQIVPDRNTLCLKIPVERD